MTHALSRRIIAPLLMIALLVPLMIPLPAQAANSRDAAFNNDAADSSQHWSYGQNLAGADITDSKARSRHNTVTVYLTTEEQSMANSGYLSYIGSAHIGANGSRDDAFLDGNSFCNGDDTIYEDAAKGDYAVISLS